MNSLFARGLGDWYGESSWVVGSEEGSDESADIFVDERLLWCWIWNIRWVECGGGDSVDVRFWQRLEFRCLIGVSG